MFPVVLLLHVLCPKMDYSKNICDFSSQNGGVAAYAAHKDGVAGEMFLTALMSCLITRGEWSIASPTSLSSINN